MKDKDKTRRFAPLATDPFIDAISAQLEERWLEQIYRAYGLPEQALIDVPQRVHHTTAAAPDDSDVLTWDEVQEARRQIEIETTNWYAFMSDVPPGHVMIIDPNGKPRIFVFHQDDVEVIDDLPGIWREIDERHDILQGLHQRLQERLSVHIDTSTPNKPQNQQSGPQAPAGGEFTATE